jgi:hypothetical protein
LIYRGKTIMSTDDELREILQNTAGDISRLSSNPRTWQSWLVYLLTCLEKEAIGGSTGNKDAYKEMLAALQDAIRNYSRTGSF